MLDRLPDPLLVLDADGTVVDANAAALGLLRHGRDSLVGRPAGEALRPRGWDGAALWTRGWHRSVRLRSVRRLPEQDVVVRRADGEDIPVLATGSYQRDAKGALTGIHLALRDGRRRAGRAATGVDMVSTVSHELRAPLTSIKGYASLLLNRWDRVDPGDRRAMLEQVNHDADRVSRLLAELLDIGRLETGSLVLRRQPVDLAILATDVVDKVSFTYPELDANLRFPRPFPMAWADPDKVVQVLTNLVENACKYGSPAGLEVVGAVETVDVAVAVRDRGAGIPAEELAQVFSKFSRLGPSRASGSGLGLWISRRLVEAHGGRLTASSQPEGGTEFRFTLPLMDLDDGPEAGPSIPAASSMPVGRSTPVGGSTPAGRSTPVGGSASTLVSGGSCSSGGT